MTTETFTYRPETPADSAGIEALHAEAFGPGRFARAAFRLREGVAHDPALSFVAIADGGLAASVRLTPIVIGTRPALLLGPLAVDPAFKGKGAGRQLVRLATDTARNAGHAVVLLVGDMPYYGPLGFEQLELRAVTLPAPVDPERVLVAGLVPGALDGLSGLAQPLSAPRGTT